MEFSKKGVNLSVCSYCLEPINQFSRTTDHLFPKSQGGILSNKNKVPACQRCNQMKGDLSVIEFQKSLESTINFEQSNFKKTIGLLKKIKFNTEKIISNL
jgi:5-methylcytosine-specific restriction endonuclease McrA